MNEFQKLITHGIRQTQKVFKTEQNEVLKLEWEEYEIPCIPGVSDSVEQVVDGGIIVNDAMIFIVLISDLEEHADGNRPKQGDIVMIDGKELSVVSVSFDPADASLTIATRGESQ